MSISMIDAAGPYHSGSTMVVSANSASASSMSAAVSVSGMGSGMGPPQ